MCTLMTYSVLKRSSTDHILLFRPIRNALDFQLLQEDVNALFNWVYSNFLCFNAKKCKQMLVSRNRNQTSILPIKIGGDALEVVNEYRYLGIWVTSSLSWNRHVEEVCKRANRQVGVLYRCFYQNCSSTTLIRLYIALVRPHLEYAVPVWDPHLNKNINSIERVQRFALKVCTKSWGSSYDDLLSSTGLPTLSERCKKLKLCVLYQILHHTCHTNHSPLHFRTLPVNIRSRNSFLLSRPTCHTQSYYDYSFFPHSISLWNKLPESVLSAPSLDSFKYLLSHYLM